MTDFFSSLFYYYYYFIIKLYFWFAIFFVCLFLFFCVMTGLSLSFNLQINTVKASKACGVIYTRISDPFK